MTGLQTSERGNIDLSEGIRIGVDVALETGGVSEKMVGSAETPLLKTSSTDQGQNHRPRGHRRVADRSRQRSRELFFLAGGVALAGGGHATTLKFPGSIAAGFIKLVDFEAALQQVPPSSRWTVSPIRKPPTRLSDWASPKWPLQRTRWGSTSWRVRFN